MITLKDKAYKKYGVKQGTRSKIEAEVWVDEVNELPAPNAIDGYTLTQGSIAYVIHSGAMFILDGAGEWYSAEGEKV